MASANKTTHYSLNQWAATDSVLRTDFNADNAKIDAALASIVQKCTPVYGTYMGDGNESQTIYLGFQASVVLILPYGGSNIQNLVMNVAMAVKTSESQFITITSTGFTVRDSMNYQEDKSNNNHWNRNPYRYLAFR